MAYNHDHSVDPVDGTLVPLKQVRSHTTTVYKVQEAFNNVTLPEENVYRNAITKALGKE